MSFFALFATSSLSAADSPRIAFFSQGQLVTQAVSGGRLRPATPMEQQAWRAHGQTSFATSPDGMYRAIKVESDSGDTSFRIVSTRTGNQVVSAKAIAKALKGGGWLYFNGWLPDSKHFSVTGDEHISSDEFYKHAVVDVTCILNLLD